jgi:hypothetical protein
MGTIAFYHTNVKAYLSSFYFYYVVDTYLQQKFKNIDLWQLNIFKNYFSFKNRMQYVSPKNHCGIILTEFYFHFIYKSNGRMYGTTKIQV